MKLLVDFDLCESNALCVGLAPQIFSLDDDDFLELATDEISGADLPSVRRAVAACPRSALSLVES
jgi:ferredoxin